jgi:hypothetical protein
MPANTPLRSRLFRAALALSGLTSLIAGLVLLPSAPGSLAASSAGAHPSGVRPPTGRGVTVFGPKMWDPSTRAYYPYRSTVTVSQTTDLTHQSIRVSWTGFTPTNWQGVQPYNNSDTLYPVMVAECKGTDPTLKHLNQCYGADYEGDSATYGTWGPYNAVYEATSDSPGSVGTGEAIIDLETAVQNLALGCDSSHPCSLLVMPAQGGNKVTNRADAYTNGPYTCKNHRYDGSPNLIATASNDFGGFYSPCSWDARIVVPLHFAPTPSICPRNGAKLTIAGSPMLGEAMVQWDTGLCSGSDPLTVTNIASVSESEAINQLYGGLASVALTTLPASGTPSGNKNYTYAPVGVSAVVVGYWADRLATGNPQTGIKLDPRLIAKMLTTSYNLEDVACPARGRKPPGCDPDIAPGNPADIFADPEFTKLNPDISAPQNANQFSDVPIVLLGDSDMTYELTRWIAANPDAESFLQGTADPWGMTVNGYYKGTSYPVTAFSTNDRSGYIQAAYSPVATLTEEASDVALGAPPGDTYNPACPHVTSTCPNGPTTAFTPESSGSRALFSVLDYGDAANFDVPVAALLNHAGNYVEPTAASMTAALNSMVTASNGITKQVSTTSNNPDAYPLTMVVYAMVPTSHIPRTKAALIAKWLRYVAGPGQTPGRTPGKLAPGYLPLPKKMVNETLAVASEVAKDPGGTSGHPSASSTTSTSPASSVTSSPSPGGSLSASPSASISLPAVHPRLATVAVRDPQAAGAIRYALPVVLILGGLATLGGAAAFVGSGSGTTTVIARLRRTYRAGIKRRRS